MGEAHQINSGQPCMDRLEKRIEHEKGSLKLEKAKENKGASIGLLLALSRRLKNRLSKPCDGSFLSEQH